MRFLARFLVIVCGLGLLAYLGFSIFASPIAEHPYVGEHDIWVLAHQGGNELYPDNTLYAFERAKALGVDVLELDIHSSADGELVVIHDDTVDRTTDGEGRVNAMTLETLKTLDAGYHWSPEGKGELFPYRDKGIRIPTLKEIFAAFPDTRINIEIKQREPSIVSALCQLIGEEGRSESVMVGSFSDTVMKSFRQTCPEVATSAASNEARNFFILNTLFLANTYSPSFEAFQVPEYQGNLHVVTQRFLTSAERKNVDVHVWTVNETADIRRLIELGVDGIISDRPDRVLRLLGRLPPDFVLPEGVPE